MMFELNKVYQWGSAVVTPYMKDPATGEEIKIEGECQLAGNYGVVPLIKGVWEPKNECMCKCTCLEPLMFTCDVDGKLIRSKQWKEWAYNVELVFNRFGVKLSEHEKNNIVDMFSWQFEYQQKCATPDAFENFFIERLSKEYMTPYNGSYNGAMSADQARKFFFDLLFGVDATPVICYLIDSYIDCKVEVSGDKIKVVVCGFDLEEYASNVLSLNIKKGVGSMLARAQG